MLPIIEPMPCDFSMTSPLIAFHSNAPSGATSTYYVAPEYLSGEDEDDAYRPFPTMESLCRELGLSYPLERQIARYVNEVGGYNGPVIYSPAVTTTVTELRERPIRKVTRRVSVVGRQARKLSGELGRRASRLLRLTTVPDLIRAKERTAMDNDSQCNLTLQVDLGREVSVEELEQDRAVKCEFRTVEWEAS
jgi:hypothetical protein